MESQSRSFKDLVVWQKALTLSKEVYILTKKLPKNEEYALVSQLRRCDVSIPSNIAEGAKRGTKKDFLQFLRIASGSAAELETQLLILKEVYPEVIAQAAEDLLSEVQRMLTVLIKKMNS